MARENYWTKRVPRRNVLGGAAVTGAGLAGMALAGCGGSSSSKTPTTAAGKSSTTSPGSSATAKPSAAASPTLVSVNATSGPEAANIPKDGILNLQQGAPFASINPYKGLDSGLLWGFTIYDHLWYTPLDTGIRENFLASSIEQPDPLHINVKIQDAVFQNKAPANGRAIKASDIKASLESAATQTAISNSSWWTQTLDHIEAPDDHTVQFFLKQVDAWTFSSTNGGSPIATSIMPEEIAKNINFMDTDLVGSGRFQFVSAQNGSNFTLKRNDNWRLKPQPYLAGIQYKLIQQQAQALAAFSDKQIDQVTPNNKLEKDQLVSQLGDQINIQSDLSRAVWLVEPRADGQWADPRVNQAISMALDKDQFIQLMSFGEGKKSGPVPPSFVSQALTDKEIADTYGKFDVTTAKSMLSASGFDLTKTYQIKYYTLSDPEAQFGQIIQSQLQKNLGIKTTLVGEEFGKWLAQSLYGSQFDGFIIYPTLAYDDPSSYIGIYAKQIGGRPNWSGFQNDELDQLVTAQKAILDDAQRNKAVHDIQLKAWAAGAPALPIFVPTTYTANWNYFKGQINGRGSYGLFAGTWYIDKH